MAMYFPNFTSVSYPPLKKIVDLQISSFMTFFQFQMED